MITTSKVWAITVFVVLLSGHFFVDGKNVDDNANDPWRGLSISCTPEDPNNSSLSCHGVRMVRRIIQQLLNGTTKSIELSEGVSLVETEDSGAAAVRRARNLKGLGNVGTIVGFLEGKELRIKLPSLIPDNLQNSIIDSLPKGRGHGGGFGGGKKGDNSMMIMAVMMGKMMAAIGFGSLGMLAMKALLVSSLALMLSLIVAAKKFTSGNDSGGGHHVVYAQESGGHHSRKRSVDNLEDPDFSPYSGYSRINRIARRS